jgi:hypothetical protein
MWSWALAAADRSDVTAVAIDETSYRRGHEYLTLVADMQARRVVFVTTGKDASTIERLATYLSEHGGSPGRVGSVSIDMSPAFIQGVNEHLPEARVTFDKFHVVAHASKALDAVGRQQQKLDPELKGMRWTSLKDADKLNLAQLPDLEAFGQSVHNQSHRARLALPRTIARHSRAQTNQRCLRDAAPVVHQRHALQGRAHEGCRPFGSRTFRWNHCLDPDPSDQRFHRSQSTAFFRQQSARLVDMHALKPCARSCFSLPENLTSPRSTRMPAEPHYPLSFQKSETSFTL